MNLFELMGVQAPAVEKKEVKKAVAVKTAAKAGSKAVPQVKHGLPKTFNVLGTEELEITQEMAGGLNEVEDKAILKAVKEQLPWVVTEKHLYVEGDCILVRPSAGMAKGELEQEAEKVFLGKEDLFPAFPEKEGLHVARKAAVISSVLFGLSHGAPLQAVYALIMGFALCVIFELRGGLAASALTHACVNLLVSVLMFTGLMESLATPACCAAFGAIALLLAVAAFRRKAP